MTLPIFIGYDEREAEAFDVCRASLLRHTSEPLHIVRLDQAALRRAGWYRREWRHVEGQMVDLGDLKPFSTAFAFTRFLVPALSLYDGWALFCDGDFLFTDDVAKLFALADDRYAVMCVKHDHDPAETSKMGGIVQSRYRRKNWSSLTLYNCGHPSNGNLTGYMVNEFAGQWLHAFNWLTNDEIGALPIEWNWLSGISPDVGKVPAGIHFTLGVPTMPGCNNSPHAGRWLAERALMQKGAE
jgi:hypothetical protein